MANLHHTQAKQAAKLGIEILKDGFRHNQSGKSVPMGDDPRATFAAFVAEISGSPAKPKRETKSAKVRGKAKAKRKVRDEDEENDDEDEDQEVRKSGMIHREYYEHYQKLGNGCADELDMALRDAFRVYKLGKKGQPTKDYRFDLEGFEKWAKACGVWRETFKGMNPGQIRMNCSNVARQMIKDGEPLRDFLKHLPK